MVVSEVSSVVLGRLMMVSDDGERLSVPATPSRMICSTSVRQPYLRDHSPCSSRSGRCFPHVVPRRSRSA